MDMEPEIRLRHAWHIITSDEVASIQKLLAEIEQDAAGYGKVNAQEISRMITMIERRRV
ncbi:hypothetical protein [Methanoregula boonei]|jgi:hypothetical protein|uniref:hypothetical protein n=1 Tax=Methanoregula boonei TaxID=358766 RepID=UPI0012F723B7|nr:hypothetical protein [Methanoregula boonei]